MSDDEKTDLAEEELVGRAEAQRPRHSSDEKVAYANAVQAAWRRYTDALDALRTDASPVARQRCAAALAEYGRVRAGS